MMTVQFILFFILGIVTTAFIVILLCPAVWRYALFLSYKAIRETGIPPSLQEGEDAHRSLRVQYAIELCRLEEKLKAEQDAHARCRISLDAARERVHALSELERSYTTLQNKLERNSQLLGDLQKKSSQEQQYKSIQLKSKNRHSTLTRKAKVDKKVLRALRNDIKSMAAMIAAQVAENDEPTSPINRLTNYFGDEKSLATLIRHFIQKKKLKRNG
ncbi:MAG: hypothetical protein JSC085_000988 [Candidatus Tokpelaia sp. JSC085]|nr:MAG: hypothetical protein JSC085_000988 [Candidatus Tokpelaia sp. JSC085]